MPPPILKSIFRNFFLEAALQAFLEKVGINFNPNPDTPTGELYMGVVEVGMHFSKVKARFHTFDNVIIEETGIDGIESFVCFSYDHPHQPARRIDSWRYMGDIEFYR